MPNWNDLWAPVPDAINDGTWDPVGDNYVDAYFNTSPSILPGIGGPKGTASPWNTVARGGTGGEGGDIGATLAQFDTRGSPVNNTPKSGASGGSSDSVLSYFLRGIIVILGFIFVAVGLHSLAPSVVPAVPNPLRRG